MHVRDEEIKRLIFYAKALGVKITIRDYNSPNAGEWSHEPISEININKKYHNNKTQLILTILHEISHAKYFVLNQIPIPEGFSLEANRKKNSPLLQKKLRKEMMDYECNGLELMSDIAVEVGLKIATSKILIAKEIDQWTYQFYYETGEFPALNIIKMQKSLIKNKYKEES